MPQIMKFNSMEALHIIGVNMLVEFDRLCEEEGWAYSLAGGTLLGAIRNKGYLPWDDDIDVFMKRPDYEAFVKKYGGKSLSKEYYKVVYTDAGEPGIPFARLLDTRTSVETSNSLAFKSLWMDILPIDGIPETKEAQKQLIKKMSFQRKRRLVYNSPPFKGADGLKRLVKTPIAAVARALGLRKVLCHKLIRSAQTVPYEQAVELGELVAQAKVKGTCRKDTFADSVLMEFGGHQFKAMPDWDYYLKGAYGNYMQVPAPRLQLSHEVDFSLDLSLLSVEEKAELMSIPCKGRNLVKKVQIELLKTFDKLCEDNGWAYSLVGESLKGAKECGGYLEGVNTLEVAMLRADYDAMMKTFGNFIFAEPYYQFVYELNGNDSGNYAKMQDLRFKKPGNNWVCIDILPLDDIPENAQKKADLLEDVKKTKAKFKKLCVKAPSSVGIVHRITNSVHVSVSTFTQRDLKMKEYIRTITSRYCDGSETEVADLMKRNNVKGTFHKATFAESKKVSFEGVLFNAAPDYEEYLKKEFTDDKYASVLTSEEKISIDLKYFSEEDAANLLNL
ncbi:MAG: LicD family protein [Lachnospiraceae bacterium]|nr:LicD family protein [Lachnospiraceae bacterium]